MMHEAREGRPSVASRAYDPFDGTGEMRARCRAFDWSRTALGPVSEWSHGLRTTVANMMATRHPMFLWWGPELVQIFNDGYLPSFGTSGRDVAALGARGREHWSDIWHLVGPEVASVMALGEASWHENHLVPIERNGRTEDVWWTYGYSPVRDDDGSVNGVLVVVQETTTSVIALRERERLLALADALAAATTVDEVAAASVRHAPLVLGATGIIVARLQDDDTHLAIVDVSDLPDRLRAEWNVVPIDAVAPLADVARTGEPLFLPSREAWSAYYPDLLPTLVETGHHANAIAPLIGHGRVIGVLGAAFDCQRAFESAERALMLTVASQCGQAFERARLYETERATLRQLERANRVKTEFLAVMSHELRTPLNAIGGYAELIDLGIHGPVTPDQHTALSRIQLSQRHLLGLIESVSSYARIEAGATRYDLTDVLVDDVLRACEAIVLPQARAKRIDLRSAGWEPTLRMRADPPKAQQILLNLLSNALKFTHATGTVTFDCLAEDELVRIRVRDTGPGVAEEYLERIFQPFVQIDTGLSSRQEGTGLGLAISRDLARGMGGDLIVESAVGAGSTFTLILPRG
jgi:signal transduction histidine kinase